MEQRKLFFHKQVRLPPMQSKALLILALPMRDRVWVMLQHMPGMVLGTE